MATRQVNSIQELFRVKAIRQTESTEPSVDHLVSFAEIDDNDVDNTVLQAWPIAELIINDESELNGKRLLQQVILYLTNTASSMDPANAEQNRKDKIASRTIRNFSDRFRGKQKENLMNASCWWKYRDTITASL